MLSCDGCLKFNVTGLTTNSMQCLSATPLEALRTVASLDSLGSVLMEET